jgi:hypothetical protein
METYILKRDKVFNKIINENYKYYNTLQAENTAVGIRNADHVAPSIRKRWH